MSITESTPRATHPTAHLNARAMGLRCITCGSEYPLIDLPAGCPRCAAEGQPSSLEVRYSEPLPPLKPKSSGYGWGQWLPYLAGVSLGEGNTPCLEVPALARELGAARLYLKNEGHNPTGSHKDRMSSQAICRALDVGADTVVLASSGNAAVSAAAYCAAAGLRCEVATYKDMPEPFAVALHYYGATRLSFDSGPERWQHVRTRTERDGAFALTNYSVPAVGSPVYGVEGYRAIALEWVAEGCRPDHVLIPTARGDLVWGVYSALRNLVDAGVLERLPRLWAVEPFPRLSRVLEGACVHADFPGQTAQFSTAGNTVTRQQLVAVRASGGGAVGVNDQDAAAGVHRLAQAGFWVELCAGGCWSAARQLRRSGLIAPHESVLLLLTAKGDRDPFRPHSL